MRQDDDDPASRSVLPLRATGIVLTAWFVGLVILSLVVLPVLFATCASGSAP